MSSAVSNDLVVLAARIAGAPSAPGAGRKPDDCPVGIKHFFHVFGLGLRQRGIGACGNAQWALCGLVLARHDFR